MDALELTSVKIQHLETRMFAHKRAPRTSNFRKPAFALDPTSTKNTFKIHTTTCQKHNDGTTIGIIKTASAFTTPRRAITTLVRLIHQDTIGVCDNITG